MNPKDIEGMRKPPLHLIPGAAKVYMAMALKIGADNPERGAWNWRREKIDVMQYIAAAERHVEAWKDGEDYDPSGVPHLGHALASVAILVDALVCGCANDTRPPKGKTAELIRQNTAKPTQFAEHARHTDAAYKGVVDTTLRQE